MVDVPGNSSTSATLTIGGSAAGELETTADHDWYRIELTAGQAVSISLDGVSLPDAIVRVRSASGSVLYTNDDGGPGLDSLLAFTAPATGTYYIDVGSAPDNQTGTYQVSVAPYTLPPVASMDEIATWLTHGFWDGDAHHFDVTQGGTITVNLTGLPQDNANVARAALAVWTDVIGVNFVEVSSGGQIVFDDLQQGTGAFSDGVWSNGITSSATVNVSADRLGVGPGIARTGLQTYIHEIGHALGLGHAGDYNGGTAFSRYPYEALFINDGAAVSVMSYFDNVENSYYRDQGFTNTLVVTPQLADIIAAGNLYGLSTTTRLGDTTYGFNNTSGREIFDALLHPNVAYTIVDSGGVDTLDYSGFAQDQLINLNAETFSNVGAGGGNVVIARGTVIENARGGSGDDTIIGNDAANALDGGAGADDLHGGAGHDWLSGGAASDTLSGDEGDDILDGGSGADAMAGGAGSDEYHVDDAGDAISESDGAGIDRVYSTVNLSLAANVEQLFLIGAALNGAGNALNNLLVGNEGDNILNGAAGADMMRGGAGDDIYYVDSGSDLAVETAAEGTDLVYSSVSYRLRENVENLVLTGTTVQAYGNGGANRLIGNNGANVLDGLGGADIMRGGLGNDRYHVDNAGDRVIELSGQGIDGVISSITYKLTGNVENLTITGTAVRATGNTLANVLVGNDANNVLNGGFGNDVMRGGAGNDTYFVFDSGDAVVENVGEGRDRVDSTVSYTLSANVEDLFLRGSSAINGTGNALGNLISGNSGNNILDGRGGADDLRGGNGADTFVFRDGEFGGLTSSTADRIIDFNDDQNDHIDLSAVDANTLLGGDQAFDFIGTAGFHGVAGELRYQQLGGNTYVYGDTDGDGTADFMIRVDGLHSLVLGDFLI